MKNTKHSLGWHTVKRLSKKNQIQRAVILLLVLLWVLSYILGLTGGK